jgi:hypothetical protein
MLRPPHLHGLAASMLTQIDNVTRWETLAQGASTRGQQPYSLDDSN